MDDQDPISQFFPGQEYVDLYAVLGLSEKATVDEIKKAYRRLALLYHPDKHSSSLPHAQSDASTKFQQVGFAYAVLSDEKRRQRYDRTGKTDEGFDPGAGEDGWEAYFEDLFERVTRGKLDEMKKEYQGSGEEIQDVKTAYIETAGSIGEIINYISHSTIDDEPRIIVLVSNLVKKGELPALPAWESSIKDEKARLVRKKQSQKEAKEAEDMAKELGVWDEFYGSGKTGQRKGKGKGKGKQTDDEDHSALQALMLRRKEKTMDGFFDNLAAKYAEPLSKKVGKRRQDKDVDMEGSPRKRSRGVDDIPPPQLDDEEFEKLQKTFGDKVKPKSSGAATSRNTRARKAKTTK